MLSVSMLAGPREQNAKCTVLAGPRERDAKCTVLSVLC